jgi:hypothetical protein
MRLTFWYLWKISCESQAEEDRKKIVVTCLIPRLLRSLRLYLSILLSSPKTSKRFLSSKGSQDLLFLLLSLTRRIEPFVLDENNALLFCRLLLPFFSAKFISEDVKIEVFELFCQFISHVPAPAEFVRPIVYLFESTKSYSLRQILCEILMKLQGILGSQSITIGTVLLNFSLKYCLTPTSFLIF